MQGSAIAVSNAKNSHRHEQLLAAWLLGSQSPCEEGHNCTAGIIRMDQKVADLPAEPHQPEPTKSFGERELAQSDSEIIAEARRTLVQWLRAKNERKIQSGSGK